MEKPQKITLHYSDGKVFSYTLSHQQSHSAPTPPEPPTIEPNPHQPRGIRNNNPLNIRISDSQWQGKVAHHANTDGAFEQFIDMPHGIRAAMINIRTYIQRYELNTIQKIITRWAPPNDGNHTEHYIQAVCSHMGISRQQRISFEEGTIIRLVDIMSQVENGGDYLTQEELQEGWNMI